jgi:PPOX class probable F420-dependent enzyme
MMPLEDQFSGRRYISLESYKKNGEPKQTPVQSLENNGLIYIRTDPKTWKVKRIERNSLVRIALSDRKGKTTGSWVSGEARIVEGKENVRIQNLFKREYGAIGNMFVNFVAWLRREKLTTVISIKLETPMPT